MKGCSVGCFAVVREVVQECFESVEATFPAVSTVRDPAFGGPHGFGHHLASADPPDLVAADHPRCFKNLEVLQNAGERDGEGGGQIADGGGPLAEAIHQGEAGGVAEGVEIGAEVMVKHLLEYWPAGVR